VPVLITTGVTSRGEKGLRIRRRQSLRFRCSPGYCQNQSHTNKQKAFPDWNLLDVLDVRLGNAVALTLEISPDDMIIERI
jgi:hypothetical protein